MEEIWKTVIYDGEVYEGYEVSNMGRIRSLNYRRTGKIQVMKPTTDTNGYLQARLMRDGKQKICLVHRLVATAFIENSDIENKTEINHIDENKKNNRADNLEWVTHKKNINHGTRNERTAKAISKKICCVETGIVYESTREVERKTGLNHSSISKCCNGKQKTVGGYHWEYVN